MSTPDAREPKWDVTTVLVVVLLVLLVIVVFSQFWPPRHHWPHQ